MVEPAGLIGYDISKPANRVCSRRWPHAELFGDVREIDEKVVVSWSLKYPHIVEIHLWGGFPCVGLSSVRYMRKNLAGPQSGLFREILRVLELLRKIFGRNFKIRFFVENVASMDRSAAEEVSQAVLPGGPHLKAEILLDQPTIAPAGRCLCEPEGILH